MLLESGGRGPVGVPDEDVPVAGGAEHLLLAGVENDAADAVVVAAKPVDDVASVDVDDGDVGAVGNKCQATAAVTKRRRQSEFETRFRLGRTPLELLERRFHVSAGQDVPSSHLRLVVAERDECDAVVAERDAVGRPRVSFLLRCVDGCGRLRLLRNVVHVEDLEAAPGTADIPKKNLASVAAASKKVIALVRPSHGQNRIWKKIFLDFPTEWSNTDLLWIQKEHWEQVKKHRSQFL